MSNNLNEKARELLPCPFCGSSDIGERHVVTYSVDSSYNMFGCDQCLAGFEEGDATEWNRRAELTRLRAQVTDEMVERAVAAFGERDGFVPFDRDADHWAGKMRAALTAALEGWK